MAAEPTPAGKSAWVLVDPRAGTANQALGIAARIGLPVTEKTLSYGMLAKLPNFGASLRSLTPESRAGIAPPWPDLVIAAGRRSAAVARFVKRQSPSTRLVQVMHPGGSLNAFDLVIIPTHDAPPAQKNVMVVTGAPHSLTRKALDATGAGWRDRFEGLPRPWIALLVGGATKRKSFPLSLGARLADEAARMAEAVGGSLLVTTSRRTGEAAAAFDGLSPASSYVYRPDDTGENPYRGILGLADAVIVTGDSVSMACEAAAAGVPLWIFSPPGFAIPKHEALHRELYDLGIAKPFSGTWETWSPPPLDEAGRIAERVRALLED